jgi:hypothetical protein
MSRISDTRARSQRSVWVMLVGPSFFIDPIDVENEGERKFAGGPSGNLIDGVGWVHYNQSPTYSGLYASQNRTLR